MRMLAGGFLARVLAFAGFGARIGSAQETGSVTGRVRLTTRVRGTALPSNAYQPRAVTRRETPAVPEIKNVVVYLKDITYRGTLPVSRREIRQKGETFLPRVLAVTRGSTVAFPNADPFYHNVFSLSSAATFDLERYPRASRVRQMLKPGLVKVFCHSFT